MTKSSGPTVTVLSAHDAGDDRLVVHGTIEGIYADPVPQSEPVEEKKRGRRKLNPPPEPVLAVLEAHGWVSAMENHFDESTYAEDGHRGRVTKADDETGAVLRRQNPKARQMTKVERLGYCKALLVAQHGPEPTPMAPKDLAIKG